ncbi:hypothetical protein HDV02_000772 [Globomyces sp. JEL0801]|nr:hypothetical protein HDV02_000772 [Globomyces sp. JEL0801]
MNMFICTAQFIVQFIVFAVPDFNTSLLIAGCFAGVSGICALTIVEFPAESVQGDAEKADLNKYKHRIPMTVNDTQDHGIHSDQSDATVSASDSDDELLMNTNRFKVVKKAGRNKKLESSSTNNDLPPENPTPVVEKEDLEFLRFKSHFRLKNSWDNIIEKYGKVFENDDEIDIKSQQVCRCVTNSR